MGVRRIEREVDDGDVLSTPSSRIKVSSAIRVVSMSTSHDGDVLQTLGTNIASGVSESAFDRENCMYDSLQKNDFACINA